MSEESTQEVIADEAATEKRYSSEVSEKARRRIANQNQISRNTWTDKRAEDSTNKTELIGRVSLKRANNEYLDGAKDFYIGTTHHSGSDYEVFSWAAPVSCTFFRRSEDHHPLCEEVAGLRVLSHTRGEIKDFEDIYLSVTDDSPLFEKRALRIPKAPSLPSSAEAQGESEIRPANREQESTLKKPDPETTTPPTPPAPKQADVFGDLRAPGLLRRELAKPKSKSMSSVLSTLQPDQFELIARPASETQFIQGHPGTGKTIIAVHRVAYLLNKEAPPDHKPKQNHHVLLLGPTEEWVAHVRKALSELVDDSTKYVVQSISRLLDELAELPPSTAPTESNVLEDVDRELARLVDEAIKVTKDSIDKDDAPTPDDVYSELIWFTESPPAMLHRDYFLYLKSLPPTLDELKKRKSRRHRGLLAYLKVRTQWPPDPGHVIVDEAQDIHPIEWEVLGRIGNRGGWTILGDLNQRRTDHTFSSWDDVAELLAEEDENGEAPLKVLSNGYRSTQQIIKYANQLLPSHSRHINSLQDTGEIPKVKKIQKRQDLPAESVASATELLEKEPTGSVAIIAVSDSDITRELRSSGWVMSPNDSFEWQKDSSSIRVLPPQRARGLEFDGVVVVEPGDFPENFGRHGVLYTALTRANKHLTVLHSRALPKNLKKP